MVNNCDGYEVHHCTLNYTCIVRIWILINYHVKNFKQPSLH